MKIAIISLTILLLVITISGCGVSSDTVVNLMREGTLDIYQPEAAYGYRGVNIAISKEVFTLSESSLYVLDDKLNRVNPILGEYYYLYQVVQLGQVKYVLSQHKYSDSELK
jgi:hypothetical protein